MENLKSSVNKVLINTLDYTKVGAFYDSVAGVNVLSFKQNGINIPYSSSAFKGFKACTDEGSVKSLELELSPDCPCTECDWEYSITLSKIFQRNSRKGNKANKESKSYGGIIPKVSCTGGSIDDQYLLEAEDDIITQIYEDTGLHDSSTFPEQTTAAIVNAYRVYYITCAHDGNEKVDLTETSTGVTTNVNLGATAVLSAAAINASAANTYLRAVNVTATKMAIYSLTGADLFTLADGGGATTITIDARRIWLVAKHPRLQFDVTFDNGFATIYKRYQFVIDGSAAAATANSGITLFINGTAHHVASAASVAAEVTAINAVGATHEVYATVNGTDIYVTGTDAVTSLSIAYSLSPSNYTSASYTAATPYFKKAGVYSATATGSFPLMTGEDLKNELANIADEGIAGAWSAGEQVDPSAEYCAYFFQHDALTYAQHGASHMDYKRQQVILYIKKSLIDDDFLYSGTNAVLSGQGTLLNAAPSTTANVNFEELLQVWAGGTWTGTAATGGSNPNAWTN